MGEKKLFNRLFEENLLNNRKLVNLNHKITDLENKFDNIPEDTDIILTHDTPMLGDLDLLPPSQWNPKTIHAGGKSLADAICRVQPRYVFCGHLHTCKDKYLKLDNTEIYNVSILDNNYKEIYKPLYLDI